MFNQDYQERYSTLPNYSDFELRLKIRLYIFMHGLKRELLPTDPGPSKFLSSAEPLIPSCEPLAAPNPPPPPAPLPQARLWGVITNMSHTVTVTHKLALYYRKCHCITQTVTVLQKLSQYTINCYCST